MVWGSVVDYQALVKHRDVRAWEEIDNLGFNYVPGQHEKTTRSSGGALRIKGKAARHVRVYALLMAARPARFAATARSTDAEAMWDAAVSNDAFEARTLPPAGAFVLHRVDCGRRQDADNKECTAKAFGDAVESWKAR